MNLTRRLAIVFVCQASALACIVVDRQRMLARGTPVDPRPLFSGDYAMLRHAVNRLPLAGLHASGGEREFRRHEPVYPLLRCARPYWQPVSVHATMPATSPEQVVLRGEVQRVETVTDRKAPAPVEARYLRGAAGQRRGAIC